MDHEVFVLTDSSAFEGSYYKGHSTSKELSDIVFSLYKAQRTGGFILHVLHISGKRMKATGVMNYLSQKYCPNEVKDEFMLGVYGDSRNGVLGLVP